MNPARKGTHATKWPPSAQEARPAGQNPSRMEYLNRRNKNFGHQLLFRRSPRIIGVVLNPVILAKRHLHLRDNLADAARRFGQVCIGSSQNKTAVLAAFE